MLILHIGKNMASEITEVGEDLVLEKLQCELQLGQLQEK